MLGLVPFQVGGPMGVEVLPDQHDRAIELNVCPHQQGAVVLPGEALAGSLEQGTGAGAVDEMALLTGFVAAQRGDRGSSPS